MKTLTLSFTQASSLLTIMTAVKLGGVRNIQRGRCLRLLKAEIELFDTERMRMLTEEHAILGEDGKPEEIEGGYKIKNAKKWNDAFVALIKDSPLKLNMATDADKGWLKLCKEIMTTKLCPEIDGQPAMDFDDILIAIEAATEAETPPEAPAE